MNLLKCRGNRHRVAHHQLVDHRLLNSVRCWAVQQPVGDEGHHPSAPVLLQLGRGLAEGSGGVYDVVHDDAVRPINRPHKIHPLDGAGRGALLNNHGQPCPGDPLGLHDPPKLLRSRHPAGIRGHHHGLHQIRLLSEVQRPDPSSVQVIHRHRRGEKPLDLPAVEVNADGSVSAHGGDHHSHVCGGDWDSGGHLTVLPGIPVIWNHCNNLMGAGAPHRGDEKEQLHQRIVYRLIAIAADWLDDVAVLCSYSLVNLDVHLAVCKCSHLAV
mmetsp:Transcript_16740/g.37047  ORF Transcript_16740/g.37047 Transcript_16740/m.37047 type:complete len:269 (-) Transcript_16740:205-1011(-)